MVEKREILPSLRELREGATLTQVELAVRAGITEQAYINIESGRSIPKVDTALAIAHVLNTTVEAAFGPAPLAEWIGRERITKANAATLLGAIDKGQPILISGTPQSGKTGFVHALITAAPRRLTIVLADEREAHKRSSRPILRPPRRDLVRLTEKADAGNAQPIIDLLPAGSEDLSNLLLVIDHYPIAQLQGLTLLTARDGGAVIRTFNATAEQPEAELDELCDEDSAWNYMAAHGIRVILNGSDTVDVSGMNKDWSSRR